MENTFSLAQTFFSGREALEWLMQASNGLILIKFVAPYCPSCKTLEPILKQIASDNVGKLHIVELDMTEEPELAIEYEVRSAPTVVLVKEKQTLQQISGLQPKKHYAEIIQSAL